MGEGPLRGPLSICGGGPKQNGGSQKQNGVGRLRPQSWALVWCSDAFGSTVLTLKTVETWVCEETGAPKSGGDRSGGLKGGAAVAATTTQLTTS